MKQVEMSRLGAGRINAGQNKKGGLLASPRARKVSEVIQETETTDETPVIGGRRRQRRPEPAAKNQPVTEQVKRVLVPESITVRELATLLKASPIDVIKVLMASGVLANINQPVDFDTAAIVAAELGYEAVEEHPSASETPVVEATQEASKGRESFYINEKEENLIARPPVVTVLGHVDHGKTTLLDSIRKTNVVASESGGITQKIGAYQVKYNDQIITFIDTPGHEAFTAMRARGAQATDIAVLVVAADDGVMPQTEEALSHARAAKVPIIVALNKVDKPGANPDRVKQQLADRGLNPDDWGGDTMMIPVSALRQQGIEELLEAILLQAEEANCRANPKALAAGMVIESVLDRSRGPLATFLVQNGTLHLGDYVVVGTTWGRVRAMYDESGHNMHEAPPSTPVQVMGLADVPDSGSIFQAVADERTAKAIVQQRQMNQAAAGQADQRTGPRTLEDMMAQMKRGEIKEINLILKTDTQGSIEPIAKSVELLQDEDHKVKFWHMATGSVSESDVSLAVANRAIVIGFNVPVDGTARRLAEASGVEIRVYDIIYNLIEDMERVLKGLDAPVYQAVDIGKAEVRQVFETRNGVVAGSFVLSGTIQRNGRVRIVRGNTTVWEGGIASLRRFTEDVREVKQGFEFGMALDGFSDVKVGDIAYCYVMKQAQQ